MLIRLHKTQGSPSPRKLWHASWGLSRQTVVNVERGASEPKVLLAPAVAAILGTALGDLFQSGSGRVSRRESGSPLAVGVILVLILRKASPAIASGTMAMVLPSEARSASGYAGPAVHGFVLLND